MPNSRVPNDNVIVRVVLRPGSGPVVETVPNTRVRTRQQITSNPADPEITDGGQIRAGYYRRSALFQMGQTVKKVRNIRSIVPIDTVFVITQVIDTPTHECPWAYSGDGPAAGGVWQDELEIVPDTYTPARFRVGQRVRKYRHIRSISAPEGVEFTITRILDMEGSTLACRWAYVGDECRGGAYEDELEPTERLAAWEEELLRATEVGTTNSSPNQVTFTVNQRVPISVVHASGLRSLTGGRLAFDSQGAPYVLVQETAWPGGVN